MKKTIFALAVFTILCDLTAAYSYDSTAAKFFPLAIGNSWSYNYKVYAQPLGCTSAASSSNIIISIVSDTVSAIGHRYYKFSDGKFYRIDSTTMNVLRWNGSSECVYDSLLARKNDSLTSCRYTINWRIIIADTTLVNFAGADRRTKQGIFIGYMYRLMYGIGMYTEYYCELNSGFSFTLNGCIINGVQYGQMLGINDPPTGVPLSPVLYQNYPNPFNPKTSIIFDMPYAGNVQIILYDAAGKWVEEILNEQRTPGHYRIEWGSLEYPSGVYFYELRVGNYSETKKMVLIK